jgi:hypothetical protein
MCNMLKPVPALRPTLEQWEGGINELHLDSLQGLLGRLNVQHVEDHRLVRAKHPASCHLRMWGAGDQVTR